MAHQRGPMATILNIAQFIKGQIVGPADGLNKFPGLWIKQSNFIQHKRNRRTLSAILCLRRRRQKGNRYCDGFGNKMPYLISLTAKAVMKVVPAHSFKLQLKTKKKMIPAEIVATTENMVMRNKL